MYALVKDYSSEQMAAAESAEISRMIDRALGIQGKESQNTDLSVSVDSVVSALMPMSAPKFLGGTGRTKPISFLREQIRVAPLPKRMITINSVMINKRTINGTINNGAQIYFKHSGQRRIYFPGVIYGEALITEKRIEFLKIINDEIEIKRRLEHVG